MSLSANSSISDSLTSKSESLGKKSVSSPSNTDTAKYISDGFKVLRFGIDSLYLSYMGTLKSEVQEHLSKLKLMAQDFSIKKQSLAQYSIEGHVFEVARSGFGRFAYLLKDNSFHIQLSRGGKKFPMAYVQISSEYLSSVTPKDAEAHLLSILIQLGDVTHSAHVSRFDSYVDFLTSVDMGQFSRESWVTRAEDKHKWFNKNIFTGISIGIGGDLSYRLYNKKIEINKKDKRYDLFELWKIAGWNGSDTVWRSEFQARGNLLRQFSIYSVDDLLSNLGGINHYFTFEWLRLTIQNPNDLNHSRWPTTSVWRDISSIDWNTDGGELKRDYKSSRVPLYKRIYPFILSYIYSYAAKKLLIDYEDVIDSLKNDLLDYLYKCGELEGISGHEFFIDKVLLRRRKFNIFNKGSTEEYLNTPDIY